jgi:hypothetical protein
MVNETDKHVGQSAPLFREIQHRGTGYGLNALVVLGVDYRNAL